MAEILGLKMEDGLGVEEDLLIEILVNLPIKSLMRFACVSKHWYALIKSRSFVTRHLKLRCNEGNECVLLKRKLPLPPEGTDESQGGSRAEVLSFHDPDSLELLVSPNLSLPPFLDHFVGDVFFDYMATCNGLLCLASDKIVILCNPALREFELLPPSPFCCPEGYVAYGSATGFGWDANTDAYKVVQLWLIVDSQKDYPEIFEDAWVRIDLFNSSTNSWRLIDAVVPWVLNDSRCNLFFHGACHWYSRSHSILSLDLSTEVFQHFEYPFSEDEKVEKLGVLNQCLSLVCSGGWADYNFECPHFSIHIWVMKEYGVKESWTKDFVIKPYTFNYPILLLKDEWLLVVTDDYQLASCALRSSEVKRFHLDGKDESMRALNFKESLISLKQVLHGKTR